jgi:hypothetical protein
VRDKESCETSRREISNKEDTNADAHKHTLHTAHMEARKDEPRRSSMIGC